MYGSASQNTTQITGKAGLSEPNVSTYTAWLRAEQLKHLISVFTAIRVMTHHCQTLQAFDTHVFARTCCARCHLTGRMTKSLKQIMMPSIAQTK